MRVKNSELLLSYIREGRTMTRREKLWLIVSLSIPSILAQISATVMFFIDASMVGHLGAKASAAIGLVESTGWLLGGLASAANMGFSVQVAHFIGANDFEAARRVLRQSLVCCLIWSLIISITAIGIAPFLPYWIGGSEEIAHDASLYFAIIGLAGIFRRQVACDRHIALLDVVLLHAYDEAVNGGNVVYRIVMISEFGFGGNNAGATGEKCYCDDEGCPNDGFFHVLILLF